ncbi:hypothetical protein [Xanthobacter autotrophicus]|uniref:hypothetical protein n=1 Tax=Xanthobacter autotrophicus TaxID=280 RepID=UPI00372C2A55
MTKAPTRDITMTTASGRTWRLLDPSPADVDFRDIAAHLAKACRFAGACHVPYSVAQHSVVVADQLPPTLRLYGLLHDAHEAYIGDIPAPMKAALAVHNGREVLRSIVEMHDAAIHAAAGLPWPPPRAVAQAVHQADLRAFATEWRDLMPSGQTPAPVPFRPLGTRIRPQPWAKAEEAFFAALQDHLPAQSRRVA